MSSVVTMWCHVLIVLSLLVAQTASFGVGKKFCSKSGVLVVPLQPSQLSITHSSSTSSSTRLHNSALSFLDGNLPAFYSAVSVACVIAFHESGHFLAAKLQGMKIDSFNIGYGPKLVSFNDSTGTEFALRALPLGGYVAFPSNVVLDPETGDISAELDDPDLIQNRPPLQRAAVISAGVVANVLLTFLISAGVAANTGITTPLFGQGVGVTQIQNSEAPAFAAGIKVGDTVTKLNNLLVVGSDTVIDDFIATVRTNEGKALSVDVLRDGQLIRTTVTPVRGVNGKVSIGMGIQPVVTKFVTAKASNPLEAMEIGAQETWRLTSFTGQAFYRAFSTGFSGSDVGGPIAVVQAGAKMAKTSPTALLGFAASLSINLAILNSLPFPALDGGQLAFVLVELIAGRPVPRNIKDTITGVAFGVLLLLGGSTVAGDIGKGWNAASSEIVAKQQANNAPKQSDLPYTGRLAPPPPAEK